MAFSMIANRWRILALLFLVRTVMAIQFQMVAALSPAIEAEFAVNLIDVGVLIGLYFAPGIFIAAPGGALGRFFGEPRVVLAGLVLMLAGGALMAFSPDWSAQLTGRVIAGIGGVLINVLLTKMVADWFVGKEISFAMAIFMTSWPVGIALALVVLPIVLASSSLTFAMTTVVMLIAAGFVAFLMIYRAPTTASSVPVEELSDFTLRGPMLSSVLVAGAIWGLYNAALAIVFSFGPQLFVSRGLAPTEAGSVTSVVLWCLAIFAPLAGIVADKTKMRLEFIAVGNLGFAWFVMHASYASHSIATVVAIGLFAGLGMGSMASLPSLVLAPAVRAFGMGLFFTIYYMCIAAGPVLAGWVSQHFSLASTFQVAAGLLVFTVCLVPVFNRFANQTRREANVRPGSIAGRA